MGVEPASLHSVGEDRLRIPRGLVTILAACRPINTLSWVTLNNIAVLSEPLWYAKHACFTGDSCSTTGYIFILGGAAICWKSKKQTIIANSTMEAELIALASASEEANWLRDLLFQIPYFEKSIAPILIHCDSTATLGRVQNRYYNDPLTKALARERVWNTSRGWG
ncbi:UNVERIFIED_CONTAM: hypothetical protein Sangu_1866600 [Sesamum angustifolium]|uniref:Uncharacterized protein n=1 Tax=Sesamum angustifolium TaxID=2727405 RepID=A0AAW2LUI1_9LAMI